MMETWRMFQNSEEKQRYQHFQGYIYTIQITYMIHKELVTTSKQLRLRILNLKTWRDSKKHTETIGQLVDKENKSDIDTMR